MGFRACDLVREYIIHEMKQCLWQMLILENDRYHWMVYASQVMTSKVVRQHIYEDMNVMEYYQHSSTIKVDIDVWNIMEALLQERVFTQTSGWHSYITSNGEAIQQAVDLHGWDVEKLFKDTHIQAYRDKLAKTNGILEDLELLVDEILDMEGLEDDDEEVEDF